MRKFNKKSKQMRSIAISRVKELFFQAKEIFSKDKELSNRYVTLARRISMKFKLKLPREIKKQYCKHCYNFLMPGENLRVRTNSGKLVYYCMECKKHMRMPINKKIEEKESIKKINKNI